MRKIVYIFSVLIIGFGIAVSVSVPAEATGVNTCAADYYAFLSDVRSQQTRSEYFKDFFTKNYCQITDIVALNDELDKTREAMRTAAFTCGDTYNYKVKYTKLLMEEYFVRHVQEFSSGTLDDFEVEQLVERKQETLDRLRVDMKNIFVVTENKVSETVFDTYFDSWASKYDEKIVKYAGCDEGPWAEVNNSLADMTEALQTINVSVEAKKRDGKLIQTDLNSDEKKAKRSKVLSSIQSFFNKFKKQEKEEVPGPPTVREAVAQSRTISDTFGLLDDSNAVFKIKNESAERMAIYQLLYGEGGARTTSDLQSLIELTNKTIEDTNTTDFPNIIKGVRKIIDKQCS